MAQFREEEHPRDNDGKFKEKGASDRVNELVDKYSDNPEQDKINSVDNKNKNNTINDNKIYSNEEMEQIVISLSKNYIAPKRGEEDENLKKVLVDIGYAKPPIKVDKKDLLKAVSNGKIIYRGVNGEQSRQYKEQFYNGEMWVGTGVGGNGVYVSLDKNEATLYTKGNNDSIICAVLPNNMKIAGKNVRKEYSLFRDNILKKFSYNNQNSKEKNDENILVQKTISFGVYCALKGYDGYLPTIHPEKNLVILNRSKLVIGKNNEQEFFLE